jgi:hypothetical protein
MVGPPSLGPQAPGAAHDHGNVYVVRDGDLTLSSAESEASAVATLRALVATAPGREEDLALIELDPSGRPLGQPRDIFDLA